MPQINYLNLADTMGRGADDLQREQINALNMDAARQQQRQFSKDEQRSNTEMLYRNIGLAIENPSLIPKLHMDMEKAGIIEPGQLPKVEARLRDDPQGAIADLKQKQLELQYALGQGIPQRLQDVSQDQVPYAQRDPSSGAINILGSSRQGAPVKVIGPDGKVRYENPQNAVGMEAGSTATPRPNVEVDANAVELAGAQFLATGQIPPGFTRQPEVVADILEAAARQARRSGTSHEAVIDQRAEYKANETALKALEKQRTMVGAFEKTATKNLDLAVELGRKVDRSGSPIVNRGIISFNQNIKGDPDTAGFVNALTAARTEYAKVLSGATGAQGVTDSARKEAEELFNKATNQETLENVIAVAKKEMANRMESFAEQKRDFVVGQRQVNFGQLQNTGVEKTLQQAREALMSGKSREAVEEQLRKMGIDPSEL